MPTGDVEKIEGKDEPLMQEAIAYALSHGLVVATEEEGVAVHVPFTLRPTPFPRDAFDLARAAAAPFNKVVDAIADDRAFLAEALRETVENDAFTREVWNIYERHYDETREDVRLGIFRSDYMLTGAGADDKLGPLAQIELNTISCAFAGLGSMTVAMHRDLAARGLLGPDVSEDSIPASNARAGVVDALARACSESTGGDPGAAVLMVVQPGERNSFDQRHLAYDLRERHGVTCIRASLADLAPGGKLEARVAGEDRSLAVAGKRIGVVYYRAGYVPKDYPSDREWAARDVLERSSAAKCPTAGYQLAGTKKVQQVLASPAVLRRFLDEDEARAVEATFAGFRSLDTADEAATEDAVREALSSPRSFVLKPQREGGGNNLYDQDLVNALGTMSASERSAYILMQRIFPPETPAVTVRRGVPTALPRCVSELGVFSTHIARGSEAAPGNGGGAASGDGDRGVSVIDSSDVGYILRTKSAEQADGGVASGVAVMDAVLFCD